MDDRPPMTDAELDLMIGIACRDTALIHRAWDLWDQARRYLPDLTERPPWTVRVVLDEGEADELFGEG